MFKFSEVQIIQRNFTWSRLPNKMYEYLFFDIFYLISNKLKISSKIEMPKLGLACKLSPCSVRLSSNSSLNQAPLYNVYHIGHTKTTHQISQVVNVLRPVGQLPGKSARLCWYIQNDRHCSYMRVNKMMRLHGNVLVFVKKQNNTKTWYEMIFTTQIQKYNL